MKENIEKELIDSINRQFILLYCVVSYTFVSVNVYIELTYYYKN